MITFTSAANSLLISTKIILVIFFNLHFTGLTAFDDGLSAHSCSSGGLDEKLFCSSGSIVEHIHLWTFALARLLSSFDEQS